jgi:hypothetical protein
MSQMFISGDIDEVARISLLHRTYWSRIWIVQEVLFARSLSVTCEKKRVSWEALDMWTQSFSSNPFEKKGGCMLPSNVSGKEETV